MSIIKYEYHFKNSQKGIIGRRSFDSFYEAVSYAAQNDYQNHDTAYIVDDDNKLVVSMRTVK